MPRRSWPSERTTCSRCGAPRVRNAGLRRRARETGLCLDCLSSSEWVCPICLEVMAPSAKPLHDYLKH